MAEPVKIAILVDGGAVVGVFTAGVPVEFVTVDYDTECLEEWEVDQITERDGSTKEAYLRLNDAESDEASRAFVMRAFELAEADKVEPGPVTCPACGYEDALSAETPDEWQCGKCSAWHSKVAPAEPETTFRNSYRCECGEEWASDWSSACNDQCPACGLKDIEPHESEEL